MDRAKTGKRVTTQEWDYQIVPKTLKEVAKEFRLEKTCDIQNPVNTDPELADTYFKAGVEAALRLGLYNEDTETVITVNEEELMAGVAGAPWNCAGLGSGPHRHIRRKRAIPIPDVWRPLSIQIERGN
jgi:hypothetical protein